MTTEERRKYAKKYREIKKKMGICIECKNKALENRVRCLNCSIKHSERGKKYYLKNIESMKEYQREYHKTYRK